jgi:hypothetical protein
MRSNTSTVCLITNCSSRGAETILTNVSDVGLGLYGSEVSSDNFSLPTVGPKLLRLAHDIHNGKGFAVVRGMKPEMFSIEDNVIAFLGISAYIGGKRGRQDEDGNMLSMSTLWSMPMQTNGIW